MTILRNTDVKKHLARAVPRLVSPIAEEIPVAGDPIAEIPSIKQAEESSLPATTNGIEKIGIA